ncbi:MAG: serine hydrolase [Saprospiraceae bacterium]|nr:serine hydrolase [Saprospiraceae bacterium]
MKTLSFLYPVAIMLFILITSCATKKNVLDDFILKDPFLNQIVKTPEYEVQILYTHVNLKDTTFRTYKYNIDNQRYFYPASAVKMPVAVLALQKKNELNRQGIDLKITDHMLTAATRPTQTPAFIDTTTASGKPNLERYIQKIFAVSDDDAYNRLYEFLGQDYINQSLKDKEIFTTSVICHRLNESGYSPEENKHTNNVRFFRDKKVLYDKPEVYASKDWIHHASDAFKGIGYIDDHDSLISGSFDFSRKNFYSMTDMESTIKRIIYPEKFTTGQRFDLTNDDYLFLRKCMSDLPGVYPFYRDYTMYYDSYVKYFIFGDNKSPMPEDIRIYNKNGNAYGYMIDCAYIENKQKGIGFFLTAVIHVNKNQIYNDGKYEYNLVGLPFLSRLGRVIYDYELVNK